MRLRTLTAAVLAGGILLTGCGGDDEPDKSSESPSGSPEATASPSETPSESPASSPPSTPAGQQITRPGYTVQIAPVWEVRTEQDDNDLQAFIEGDGLAILSISETPDVTPMPPLKELASIARGRMQSATDVKRTPDGVVDGEPAIGFTGRYLAYQRLSFLTRHGSSVYTVTLDHPGSKADATAEFAALIASWQWR